MREALAGGVRPERAPRHDRLRCGRLRRSKRTSTSRGDADARAGSDLEHRPLARRSGRGGEGGAPHRERRRRGLAGRRDGRDGGHAARRGRRSRPERRLRTRERRSRRSPPGRGVGDAHGGRDPRIPRGRGDGDARNRRCDRWRRLRARQWRAGRTVGCGRRGRTPRRGRPRGRGGHWRRSAASRFSVPPARARRPGRPAGRCSDDCEVSRRFDWETRAWTCSSVAPRDHDRVRAARHAAIEPVRIEDVVADVLQRPVAETIVSASRTVRRRPGWVA